MLSGHLDEVMSVSWNSDGTRLVSGSRDRTVRIWNPATGEQLCTVQGHTKENEECTCTHDAGPYEDRYRARPYCPVTSGDFTSF